MLEVLTGENKSIRHSIRLTELFNKKLDALAAYINAWTKA